MKVLVRVDVSRQVGTGHWRRMSNLLEALKPAEAVFAVCSDDPWNALFVGSSVRFVKAGNDVELVSAICASERIDLLLVDLLHYPVGYLAGLKARLACKMVSFHEYHDSDGIADLSVNYNTFDGYESAGGPSFLAGPAYCILNQELLRTTRVAEPAGVLVSFGGSDPSGLTQTFLDEVASRLPELPFTVHTGPFCEGLLRPLPRSGANLRSPGSDESMFLLLASRRLVVTAGGNGMYEAMYMGIVPLVVAHNSHQAEFARNAARLGACQYFGVHPEVDWSGLAQALRAEYDAPPKPRCRLIDGQGTQRLAERLIALCA
jgi:UDP-2,4-diacetamido-2,4,6-trideoxy-beta-L-altropyranose hydrolase